MNLNDLVLTESICAMFYSRAGVGRTHLIGGAGSRNVIFSDRNGLATLKNPKFKAQHPNVNPMIELVDTDRRIDAPKMFEAMKNRIDFWLDKRHTEFDTLSIDDMTAVNMAARNLAITVNGLTGRSKTVEKIGNIYKGEVVMTESDFGTEMGFVFNFLSSTASFCRQMGKNFIVGAHERHVWLKKKGEESELIGIVPLFIGKQDPTSNNTHFDLVARGTREGKEATSKVRWQFVPDKVISAKDRYAVFNTYEDNITWPQIEKRVRALEPPTIPEPTKT